MHKHKHVHTHTHACTHTHIHKYNQIHRNYIHVYITGIHATCWPPYVALLGFTYSMYICYMYFRRPQPRSEPCSVLGLLKFSAATGLYYALQSQAYALRPGPLRGHSPRNIASSWLVYKSLALGSAMACTSCQHCAGSSQATAVNRPNWHGTRDSQRRALQPQTLSPTMKGLIAQQPKSG